MLKNGDQVGVFQIEGYLGSGSVATVYTAVHSVSGARVALKIIALPDPSLRKRLIRQGTLQSTLQHPNIVAVEDVFVHAGEPVLQMAFVNGPTLGDVLHAHRLSVEDALALFGGLVRATHFAHRQGVIHRDLKPANVLLHVEKGHVIVKVADFAMRELVDPDGLNKTITGVSLGFPNYMAPEQMKDGKSASVRSDIFSLGCLLYELLTGARCFPGEDIVTLIHQMLNQTHAAPSTFNPQISESLSKVISRCVHPDPALRFASCTELVQALYGDVSSVPIGLKAGTDGGQVIVKLQVQARADRLLEAMATYEAVDESAPVRSSNDRDDHGRERRWGLMGAAALVILVAALVCLMVLAVFIF